MILSKTDQELATRAGNNRYQWHTSRDTPQQHGREDARSIPLEIDAVAAEIVVALALGEPWFDTIGPAREGDVGVGIQVRHTRHTRGHLIIHPPENPRHAFFLVTGTMPEFQVRGWIFGKHGQDEQFWGELKRNRPAFNVPQNRLRPLSDFDLTKFRAYIKSKE